MSIQSKILPGIERVNFKKLGFQYYLGLRTIHHVIVNCAHYGIEPCCEVAWVFILYI